MDVTGGDLLELRADGSASLAGQETRWTARGNQLVLGPDVMPYALQGNRLTTKVGAITLTWQRIDATAEALTPMGKIAQNAQTKNSNTAGTPQDANARQILMSSAWCSFSYNKVSGASATRKVIFRQDGVMSIQGGAETYSSGYGGIYAGQTNSASAMLWKFENMRLFVDDRSGTGYQDVGLTSTTNSNGAIILKAQGQEYSMCR